jgi:outer membrane protein
VNSNVTSGSLQLTQVLFDMSKWRALTLQEKAGIQDVTYQTDQQTLILNTATAYFNVLAPLIRSPIPKRRNRPFTASWIKPPSALT